MSDDYQPLRVKDMAVHDRPQERLEKLGPRALSDAELLAMILRTGSKGLNVIGVAQQLLAEAGSLAQLVRWSEADFSRQRGIGHIKALQLVTVMEIARRVVEQQGDIDAPFDKPSVVYEHFKPLIVGLQVEKFWALCLNRKNRLLRRVEITSGTATSALAHPREVFREAIRHGATAVLCVHNHPSGDPSPSVADVQVTRQLREAAKALDIDLVDHVIVGQVAADLKGLGYYSFRQAGLL